MQKDVMHVRYKNKRWPLPDLCLELEIDYHLVHQRIMDGIPWKVAIEMPTAHVLLYEQALQQTIWSYQAFFLHFKDDPRMKDLVALWDRAHGGNPYVMREDPKRKLVS